MKTPLHGGWFVDPDYDAIGFGSSAVGAGAGFARGARTSDTYTYPAPGGQLPILRWLGGEIPDPTVSCPAQAGEVNGAPVLLSPGWFSYDTGAATGQSNTYRVAGWSFVDATSGDVLAACLMERTDVVDIGSVISGQIYVFPQRALSEGRRYRVVFDADPVNQSGAVVGDRLHLDWAFTAHDWTEQFRFPRVADTRLSATRLVGGAGSPIFPTVVRKDLPVGRAGAVVLNVTAVDPPASGFGVVGFCDATRAPVSHINFAAGRTTANLVIVAPLATGQVCVDTSVATDVIVDVVGWIPYDAPVTDPRRVLDTRATGRQVGYTGPRPSGGQTVAVQLPIGSGFAPVVLNVTAVNAGSEGFVTVWPCGTERPLASTLNYGSGDTVAAVSLVAPDATGRMCIYTSAATDLLADVSGRLGAGFTPTVPRRVLETRPTAGLIGYHGDRPVASQVVSIDPGTSTPSSAVAFNLTATGADGSGYLTAYPCGTTIPNASNLNFEGGRSTANLVIVPRGVDGRVCVYTSSPTHLVADLLGSFAA